jgi:hypothetical protein
MPNRHNAGAILWRQLAATRHLHPRQWESEWEETLKPLLNGTASPEEAAKRYDEWADQLRKRVEGAGGIPQLKKVEKTSQPTLSEWLKIPTPQPQNHAPGNKSDTTNDDADINHARNDPASSSRNPTEKTDAERLGWNVFSTFLSCGMPPASSTRFRSWSAHSS